MGACEVSKLLAQAELAEPWFYDHQSVVHQL